MFVPLGIWLRGTDKELRNLSSGFSCKVMGVIKELSCTSLLLSTSGIVSLRGLRSVWHFVGMKEERRSRKENARILRGFIFRVFCVLGLFFTSL